MKSRGLILLAAVGFRAAPNLTLAQDVGTNDFKNRCAPCHSVEKVMDYMKAHPDAKERAAWLEQKLAGHNASDGTQRKIIIQYLERNLRERQGGAKK